MAVCAAVAVAVACLLYTSARPSTQHPRRLRNGSASERHPSKQSLAHNGSEHIAHHDQRHAAFQRTASDDDHKGQSTDDDSAAWATPSHTDDDDDMYNDNSDDDDQQHDTHAKHGDAEHAYDTGASADDADDRAEDAEGEGESGTLHSSLIVEESMTEVKNEIDVTSTSDPDDSQRDREHQQRIQDFVEQASTGADASFLELPAPRKNLAALQAKAHKANAMNAVGMRLAQYEQNDLAEKPEGRVMLQRSLQQELAQRPDRYLRRVAVRSEKEQEG